VRLGAGLLSAALAAAPPLQGQAPAAGEKRLPWEAALSVPPWQGLPDGAGEAAPLPPTPTASMGRELRVRLAGEGSLRVLDRRGVLRLKLGLPGRLARLWRDGGVPVDPGATEILFPKATLLAKGVANLPWGQPDFRPGLEGLLWVLDDGERILTVLHPATGRAQYLLLPPATSPDLVFLPDRLEVREPATGEGGRTSPRRWSLPWTGLLPWLLRLAQPPPEGRHGTAFIPFPKE
jgi:hypothetical protein